MPIIALNLITLISNPVEVMKEFVGLIALVEIDNWIGNVFELYLDTYHNDLQRTKFMELSVKQTDKIACYFYFKLALFVITFWVLTDSIFKIHYVCPILKD